MGGGLGVHQGGATHLAGLWCCLWGRGPRGNNDACSALSGLLVTSPAVHKQIGPFWCWFPGGWICVRSRTPWVSPTTSLVRLGVSPTAASTPTGFFSQRLWDFISLSWIPGFRDLSCSPVVPPGLSALECGTTWSSSCHLAARPLHPSCPSPPLLPVWMNVFL